MSTDSIINCQKPLSTLKPIMAQVLKPLTIQLYLLFYPFHFNFSKATFTVGDPFHLFAKSTFTSGIQNSRGTLGSPGVHQGAFGTLSVPDPIQFDSTTRILICTDVKGVPTAYCEIIGFSTWYVWEDASTGLNYFGGLYRIFLVKFFVIKCSP